MGESKMGLFKELAKSFKKGAKTGKKIGKAIAPKKKKSKVYTENWTAKKKKRK